MVSDLQYNLKGMLPLNLIVIKYTLQLICTGVLGPVLTGIVGFTVPAQISYSTINVQL